MILGIFLLFILAAWVYSDAKARNEPQPGAWAFGTLLLAIVVVPIWLMKRPPKGGSTRPCPFCAEPIKVEAKVCRYCHRDIGEAPQPRQQRVVNGVVVDEGF